MLQLYYTMTVYSYGKLEHSFKYENDEYGNVIRNRQFNENHKLTMSLTTPGNWLNSRRDFMIF